MDESDFEFENDTDSMFDVFSLSEFNLNGLMVFLGRRREFSVEVGDRQEWATFDSESDDNGDSENEDYGSEDNENDDDGSEDDQFAVPQGFVDRCDHAAHPMGQAIDLALCLMETQKSIDIMAGVAKRLAEDSPEDIQHITPQSTLRECKTLVRHWIAKLRQQKFSKIQAIDMDDGSEAGTQLRCWHRRVHSDDAATLADYLPHKAGLLEIKIQIIRKLAYHVSSVHVDSSLELQKCVFHVAVLIARQVQSFWVAFLVSKLDTEGTQEPAAVYSDATICLVRYLPKPSAGYYWENEVFYGNVRYLHNKQSPLAEFDKSGGFGRGLLIGDAFLRRTDGTEQPIEIDSIIGCVDHGEQWAFLGHARLSARAITPGSIQNGG